MIPPSPWSRSPDLRVRGPDALRPRVGRGHTRPDRATSGRAGPMPPTAAPALHDAPPSTVSPASRCSTMVPSTTALPAARCEPRTARALRTAAPRPERSRPAGGWDAPPTQAAGDGRAVLASLRAGRVPQAPCSRARRERCGQWEILPRRKPPARAARGRGSRKLLGPRIMRPRRARAESPREARRAHREPTSRTSAVSSRSDPSTILVGAARSMRPFSVGARRYGTDG
jgi:hypothetical protein